MLAGYILTKVVALGHFSPRFATRKQRPRNHKYHSFRGCAYLTMPVTMVGLANRGRGLMPFFLCPTKER